VLKILRYLGMAGFAALAGCAGIYYSPSSGPVGEAHQPRLEAVWAAEAVGYGNIWRVYIRASDPDGDLDKVWVTFARFGGTYPGTFVPLTQPLREANGYVQFWAWPKGGLKLGELPIYASAMVRVEDRAGNQSHAIAIPFVLMHHSGPDGAAPPAGFSRDTKLAEMEMNMEIELGAGDGDRGSGGF